MDRLKRLLAPLKRHLPPLNFITIHYVYFTLTILLSSVIFWSSSSPPHSIAYADSLFLVTSAMTEAGLNTVNLSEMTLFQQIILWVLIVLGSAVWVSWWTVGARKWVFERRLEKLGGKGRRGRREKGEGVREGNAEGGEGGERGVGRAGRGWSDGGGRGRVTSGAVGGRTEEPVQDLQSEQGNGDSHERGGYHPGLEKLAKRDESRHNSQTGEDSSVRTGEKLEPPPTAEKIISRHFRGALSFSDADHISPSLKCELSTPTSHPRLFNFVGVGAHPNSNSNSNPNSTSTSASHPHSTQHHISLTQSQSQSQSHTTIEDPREHERQLDDSHYPSYLTRHTTGRNARFFGLSREERAHLGGVEYRAISLLAWAVPVYFVAWQVCGCVGLGAYMAMKKPDVARENGINPWWLGIFNGASAFNNSGMSLLDANMIPFQKSVYPLFTMGLLILAGNTAYPLFLRLILWTMLRTLCLIHPSPSSRAQQKATLRFILTYPRRVYTNLFPSTATYWLLAMLLLLNGIDWLAFELLNLHNPATASIPPNYRVLDGLFQALAVRSGGFYVITITQLRIGLQVLYVIMMYISVYPVVITMRSSNVYEERSLGIYAEDMEADSSTKSSASSSTQTDDLEVGLRTGRATSRAADGPKLGTLRGRFKRTLTSSPFSTTAAPASTPTSPSSRRQNSRKFVRQQVRGQLAHDLWWLVLAVLAITCIEGSEFERDPVAFSVFNVVFEVVSGYGCVGISAGLPDRAYRIGFSGAWYKSSKLILCAVMLRGRHRGLPVALDRAVRLPRDCEEEAEEEEEEEADGDGLRMGRRRSSVRI